MRLKNTYEIMDVEGQSVAIPTDEDDEFKGMVKLNKTAKEIFELLQEETTEEDIVKNMMEKFDVSEDVLAADVHRIIIKFKERGMLQD